MSVDIYTTGDVHPCGAGLPVILIESDDRGGSSYVKKADGFWWFINKWRDDKGDEHILEEYPVTQSDRHIKMLMGRIKK